VLQGRIVTFFDGGVEGVAIDMGDGKLMKLGMGKKTRTAAMGASQRGGCIGPLAIPAMRSARFHWR
jgi:hypothetical protein